MQPFGAILMTTETSTPEQTLAAWEADEARVRARNSSVGVIRPDQALARPGIQLFDAMFSGELPMPHIGETLDFLPVLMEPGRAIFQGRPRRAHYNPLGTVHGGWFATLLDSCVACSIHTSLPEGKT